MAGNRFSNPEVQPPDPNKRQGFQDVNKEVVATRGVKLKNRSAEKREQEKREREEYQKKFEDSAEKTVQYHQEKGNHAIEVVSKFIKMANDKTLPVSKGSIAEGVEREIRQVLLQLAQDMNNDENEEDNGKGSVIVLSVMLKIILLYRDRINQLEYEIQQIKRDLKKKESSP